MSQLPGSSPATAVPVAQPLDEQVDESLEVSDVDDPAPDARVVQAGQLEQAGRHGPDEESVRDRPDLAEVVIGHELFPRDVTL
ncbi:hypothetical protein [Geodermatophilus sp. URMC 62]|uniref:hypothetical protein n=1 Tax=Geodermatophilus sp. URMC 62 TaxID=3423414 RepID=UPI00406D32A4